MPRGPVIYSPPPGTVPQAPNTVISSTMFNNYVDDVTQTFNTPLPKEYGGTGGVGGAPPLVLTSTDNGIVRFNGVLGSQQNSSVTISDNAQGSFLDQGVDFRNRAFSVENSGGGDLPTSEGLLLSVQFVARAKSVLAHLSFYIDQSAGAASFVSIRSRLRDITTASDIKTSLGSVVGVPGGTVNGVHSLHDHIAFDNLALGNTYEVQLLTRKFSATGPILGRNYAISGINA